MNIEKPLLDGFTIYSKSGCFYCIKVKKLIENTDFLFSIINCDDFIIEDSKSFLNYIKNIIGKEYKTFPMVFHNSKFIGGYHETKEYIENILLSFEDNF